MHLTRSAHHVSQHNSSDQKTYDQISFGTIQIKTQKKLKKTPFPPHEPSFRRIRIL